MSHASEDKQGVVEPLVQVLRSRGISVWYDDTDLDLNQPLRPAIERGLKHSRTGLVIVSPDFVRKGWPLQELEQLMLDKHDDDQTLILPLWLGVTRAEVARRAPLLSNVAGVYVYHDFARLVDEITAKLGLDSP